jgi:CBS domain-containing protein
MSVGRICVRSVVVADPGETVREAAVRMRDAGVGTVVVLDEKGRPSGVLTDRDVTMRCVAAGRDPAGTSIADVMSQPAVTVEESAPIEDALERMAGAAARRLVVVAADQRLVGVLALDDVLDLLIEETQSIGRLLRKAPRS